MKTEIHKLAKPVHAGDWHDRPLKWAVFFGPEVQQFATKAHARAYAAIRRRSATMGDAIHSYIYNAALE